MIDLSTLSIAKAAKALRDGSLTSCDLTRAYLERIKERDGEVHAYLEVFADALEQAKAADALIKAGKGGALTGIPIAVKDNILIKGRIASAASKILERYVASYDATAIEKLRQAGAVLIGRTNMDEFAMGGSTENSAFGPTKNPHDTARVPGGSSGGSAAVVAADMALAAIGSDTGGSVRQPASFCGVVGLKPTYGAISRHGLMAMGSSLDQIGPVTKTVADSETLFNIMAGKDRMDSTSIELAQLPVPAKMRIGVPEDFLKMEGIDPEVLADFRAALSRLEALGHTIVPVSLPSLPYSLAVYYMLMPAEVSSNLARFDGVKYGFHVDGKDLLEDYRKSRGQGFGREVRRRIILGTYVLSAGYYDAYYNKANIVRSLITKDYEKAFAEVDILSTPTAPTPAFKLGEKTENPLEMYLADIFTVPVNLSGVPAISVPSGTVTREGKRLPLGIQFVAPWAGEDRLFSIGKQFLNEHEA
jgi:aspartyl-tRNA(Asn)/glutamyl-tRNA(Gln) amidotransferase subunit A